MTIESLTAARNAAHAAWTAATGKAAKAAAEAALASAQAALAAAKRAAAPAPAPAMTAAEHAAAVERNRAAFVAREAEDRLQRELDRAAALYHRANEWPRCMQRWPSGPAEQAADALLRAHPDRAEQLLGF